MRKQERVSRQIAIFPLICAGFLFLASSVSGSGKPDVPSKPMSQPRSVEEQIELAGDYFVGRGVAQDLRQSAYWYEKAASGGDPQAQWQIGYFYEAGIGVAKDPARATHWYQLAASGGSVGAKVNLGIDYLWGSGVTKDESLALKLFREAEKKGSGLAACFLGDMYSLGIGVATDKAEGERWYAKGAKLHDSRSEYDLGLLFFDGKDHPHDLRSAATFLRASTEAGYVPAMYSLGLLLTRQPALANSSQEAITVLNDAAQGGIWQASLVLGVLHRDGKGVPRDESAAYYHFRVAALQGGADANRMLQGDLVSLASKLGPNVSSAIESEAEAWYQGHHFVLEFVYKNGQSRAGFPAVALAAPESGSHTTQLIPTLPD